MKEKEKEREREKKNERKKNILKEDNKIPRGLIDQLHIFKYKNKYF